MTHWRTNNPDALAYNLQWKKQQEKEQKSIAGPAIVAPAEEKPAVIPQTTPKPTGETPEECRNCPVSKPCRANMKKFYKKVPRPEFVRAWVSMSDEFSHDMICLSQLRQPEKEPEYLTAVPGWTIVREGK